MQQLQECWFPHFPSCIILLLLDVLWLVYTHLKNHINKYLVKSLCYKWSTWKQAELKLAAARLTAPHDFQCQLKSIRATQIFNVKLPRAFVRSAK